MTPAPALMQSDIPDEELSPQVLSSKRIYLFWAAAYSIVHLSLCYYLYVIRPPVFSTGYNSAVAALIVGPFFYLPDLYLRQIWWPYWREMKRRGGIPAQADRKHPYDLETKLRALIFFFATGLSLTNAVAFLWFDYFSDLNAWGGTVIATVALCPVMTLGCYHTYFIWKGPNSG